MLRTIGCRRFVFNHFLTCRKESYERGKTTMNQYACMRQLPALKQRYPWLRDVDSTAFQRSVQLNIAMFSLHLWVMCRKNEKMSLMYFPHKVRRPDTRCAAPPNVGSHTGRY
ncbi:helix-turn-helix domain-containing protein [Alicyclobacillus kakegawensis]|uniref:helix-turn-helix domain-containing protein n=1 Tax=Alicyclobacillus kakegawensis TaxID=392012 RepID=UPI0009F97712